MTSYVEFAGEQAADDFRFKHLHREVCLDAPRQTPACPECSAQGRLARGDGTNLPTLH
jgi:hypothetical protein